MNQPLFSLDSLIAGAKAKVAEKEALKTADAKLRKARSPAELTEAIAIRTAIEWRPVALALRLDIWTCRCGGHGATPGGLFILQEHTRLASSVRLVPIRHESAVPDLPKVRYSEDRVVALCPECADDTGFTRRYAPSRPVPTVSNVEAGGAGFHAEWVHLTSGSTEPTEPESDDAENDA